MKNYFYLLIFFTIIISCKNGVEKIDINNIEAHRAYQDTILANNNKDPKKFKIALSSLINEYRNIKTQDSNTQTNINYYLARLYNNVFNYPMFGNVYDSISNKFIDSVTYINYKDSSRMLSRSVLNKQPKNIRAFYLFSNSIYSEWSIFMKSKFKAPFFGVKSNDEFTNSIVYVIENASKFRSTDTTKNKIVSQEIIEYAYFFVNVGILGLKYESIDYSNKNLLNTLVCLNDFASVLDNLDSFYVLKKDFYLSHKSNLLDIGKTAKIKLDNLLKKEFEEAELAKNTFTINHDGSQDWDKDATSRSVGEEVWAACYNNPNVVRVIVYISDKCNDVYGKSTIYKSEIVINKSEINTYRKYQSANAFNANCYEWGLKLLNGYKPCGRSQFDNP